MGYRILYDGPKRRKRYALTALFFLLGLLLGVCLVPEGRRAVQTALIPGSETVTRQAGQILDAALRRGESVVASALEFCREVVSGLG